MKYIFNHFIEVHSLAIMHINWFKGFKMLRKRILTFFSNIWFFYHFLCRPLLFMKSVVETYYSQRKRFCGFKIKYFYINLVYIEQNLMGILTQLSLTLKKRPCTVMCFFKFEYRVGHYVFQIPEIFSINSSAFAVKCGLSNSKIFVLSIWAWVSYLYQTSFE